jgi:hypothetical protein
MRSRTRRLARAGAVTIAVWFATGAVGVTPAAACIGGTAFDSAVAHQHGGILRATMIGEYGRTGDFTIDMTISAPEVLRGDPPLATKVHAALGLVCDQQAHLGDTVILVFDVRGGTDPYPLPLAYVVTGPDALDAAVVSNALNDLPATDTAAGMAPRHAELPSPIASIPILAGLLTFVLALRPLRRRQT